MIDDLLLAYLLAEQQLSRLAAADLRAQQIGKLHEQRLAHQAAKQAELEASKKAAPPYEKPSGISNRNRGPNVAASIRR